MYLAAGGVALRVLPGVEPVQLIDVAGNLAWQQTVARLLAVPAPAGSDRIELVLTNRCDPSRDHITRRMMVTLRPNTPPPCGVRLDQTGMLPMPSR